MPNLKEIAAAAWAAAGAFLMRHWLLVFAAALTLLALLVLFSGKKSQDAKETVQAAVIESRLTKKQVKAKDAIIARNNDSIRTQTVVIERIVHVRDSALAQADKHDARADSLQKKIAHENATADPDADPGRLAGYLSTYKPQAWADRAAGGDSIR